jgi:hypothetical protein
VFILSWIIGLSERFDLLFKLRNLMWRRFIFVKDCRCWKCGWSLCLNWFIISFRIQSKFCVLLRLNLTTSVGDWINCMTFVLLYHIMMKTRVFVTRMSLVYQCAFISYSDENPRVCNQDELGVPLWWFCYIAAVNDVV